MQRAHHHQVVVVVLEKALDLRQPAPIALGDERAEQLRKGVVLAREQLGHLARIAGSPGREQRVGLALGVVHLLHRELEEARLLLWRELLELPELLLERLESEHRLLIGARASLDLPLDPLLGVVPELEILEIGEGERDRPRLEWLERLERQPEARGFGTELRETLLADRL